MPSSPRHRSARSSGALVCGVSALVLMLGLGSAWAQQATEGLVSSDLNSGIGLEGPGLRGTVASPDADGPASLDTVVPAPSFPEGDFRPTDTQARPQRPSPVKAAETSTAKNRIGNPKLPALEPYPSSSRPRRPGAGSPDATLPNNAALVSTPAFGTSVAALPATPLRHPRQDLTPYAPLGYSIGSLRLTPYVEESLGFDSNPDQVASGVKASGFSRTEGGFDLLSLWSANELRANMHGAYTEFFSNQKASRPDAAGTVDYRFDASRDLSLDAEGRFVVATQRPGSPNVNAAVQGRPIIAGYGTTVGANETLGRITVGLHGTFDRVEAENGRLSDGSILRLDDQNYNDYGLVGKVAYELTPGLIPFVEVSGDTRVHDLSRDYQGYARDSDGVLARIGTSYEVSRLITGTVSAGYEDRSYQDARLRDLRGPLVDAALIYAVTPLTTITGNVVTSFNETTVAGSSGAQDRLFSVQVSHALLRNLTLTGILSYRNTDYSGSSLVENTLTGTLKASYNLNRSLVLDASYNHQDLHSTVATDSFAQDVFLVGLRVQH